MPVTSNVPEPDFFDRAACKGEDPELFFPVGATGPAIRQTAEALAICHRCTVETDCLHWALDTGKEYGVWGGTSEDDRAEIQRQNTRDAGRAA